ncbi:hypothetical protein FHP29_04520 [Nocardioides albidus]|uniref:Glycosyltransferase RgtA/B/C/D-like domain-containing protein n=1 Tax=Nocardioides albidus TaxID=1517589 RepID=A0A5C4WA74_9ACTN|nr:hypothetical protein [Nocardioides albidus]TNM45081.1 hypothetical protein FHP29_04520 [Nocardioides albidus]
MAATEPPEASPPAARFPLLARAWPVATGVLLAALLVAWERRPFRAFDTYFHLRFGEHFRHDWSIGHPGQPSTGSSHDWVPTQWLAQVLLSWTFDVAGRTGLVLVFAALVTALAAALYLLLRRRAGPGTAVLLTAVVLVGLLPSLSLRPQVLSYLLFVAVLAAWDRARRTGSAPWLLVPLAWLWATCHGMWILGVGTSALLAVLVIVERRPERRRAALLLTVPVGMLAATLVTPVGPRLFSAVVLVNSRAEYFAEWGVPELLTVGSAPVALLLALAVLVMVRAAAAAPYDAGLLALGGVFAVYSGRTVPLAAIALALVVATYRGHRRAPAPLRRPELAAVLALGVVVLALAPFQTVVQDPADEVRPFRGALDALPDSSLVVTDWRTGGVLLWTHPELDVPLHGYGDVYTDAELEDYADLAALRPGWDTTLARLDPDAALMASDDRLTYALERDGWTVEQRSRDLVLLAPPVS